MPAKKAPKPSAKKPTGSKVTKRVTTTTAAKSKQTSKSDSSKKVLSKKAPTKAAPSKPVPTKEDIAAVKIQKNVRRYLAKKHLHSLRVAKKKYEETLEEIEKEAYADMVKAERKAAEKEQQIQADQRKREQEKLKRVKRMLEAAFDGDRDEMEAIVREVSKADDEGGVRRDEIGQIVRRMHRLEVVEAADVNDYSALSEAAAGGSCEAIQFLIDRGADINSIGGYGRTPLYRAAFAGHLSAVELLLQQGADPRIHAEDSCTPAQVSSIPQVVECLESWDISITEDLLDKMTAEQKRRADETEKRKKDEQTKLEDSMEETQKESERLEKILLKCYHELEKRITEYDTMVSEGNEDMAVLVMKTVKIAEEDVKVAKKDARKGKEKFHNLRLKSRDQAKAMGDLVGLKCNFKELDEVLFKDVGGRLGESGKWPLLIDTTGQASVFLRYRDSNYLCTINPSQMKPEAIRLALLGAIRFGKPLVLDMMEVDMFDVVSDIFEQVQPNLMNDVMTKEILKDEKYMSLVRATDDAPYQENQFLHQFAFTFCLIIVTKNNSPPQALVDKTYPIRVVLPNK